MWAIANPLGNSADEPAHISRAASVVRGDPIGTHIPHQPAAFTKVSVPRTYALILNGSGGLTGAHDCYHFLPNVPASCERIESSSRTVRVATYVGRYPLLYYAVVGSPSLLTDSLTGVYLMRIVSVLLSAALLAVALAVARKWAASPLLVGALVVVATPTEMFLAASVNPNGLEIAAAICLWAAGSVLVLDRAADPPTGLIVAAAGAGCVLALTRPISPLWLFLVVGALASAGWKRVPGRRLLARRDVQAGIVAVVTASALAVAWIAAVGGLTVVPEGPPAPGTPLTRIASAALSQLWLGLAQTAGTFGWDNTHEPELAVFALVIALSIPLVFCVARAPSRDVGLLIVLVGLSGIVPMALMVAAARQDGIESQGRYFMPLWVGVPIFAAATQRCLPRVNARRLSRTMVLSATSGMVLAFLWNLHRVTVGEPGPYLPWNTSTTAWHPPLPATILDAAAIVAVGIYAALALKLSVRSDEPSEANHGPAPAAKEERQYCAAPTSRRTDSPW